MTGQRSPLNVLVVGSFPAADDLIAGRFVADQVAGLRNTGRVLPWVTAFEPAEIRGSATFRADQATAIGTATSAAVRRQSVFNAGGTDGPDGVPLARLAVATGAAAGLGGDHRAIHRSAAILSLIERPDRPTWNLVHGHVGYPDGCAAEAAASRLKVPLIITEHASFLESLLADPQIQARYLAALAGAARVVAVSRTLGSELEAAVPSLAGRLVVIPDSVAVEAFRPGARSERIPDELLWVGFRKRSKGIATLLHAFRLVLNHRPEASLRLIGRSTTQAEEAGWQAQVDELGMTGSVHLEPPAGRQAVAAAMRRASCFVHPSPRETFGVVAVEALASGLPVVAVDSGGVTEIMGDDPERFGEVVKDADPARLAAAIERTLDRGGSFDPDQLHAYAEQHFGSAVVSGRIADLYDEVLHEAAGQGAASVPLRQPAEAAGPGIDGNRVQPRRTIVVCFVRSTLDRALERFPDGYLTGLEVVTSGAALAGHRAITLTTRGTDERIADVLEWGAPAAGRLGRLLRRGRRLMHRLDANAERRDQAASALVADLTRTLRSAVASSPDPGVPALVCVGGIDYLAAAPLFGVGEALPSPGGLRWLADVRSAGLPFLD